MGRVADFEAELTRQAKPQYGKWHAIDLHNHTPLSPDYSIKPRMSLIGLQKPSERSSSRLSCSPITADCPMPTS